MVVERCRFIIMLMVRYVITMVIGDVTKGFARMRYGLVVECRTHTNASRAACVRSSYPHAKLTKATQTHSTAASKSAASGVSPSERCEVYRRPIYMPYR